MSTENDTCVQLSVPDEEPVQESLQISVEDQPTEHESIPTIGNVSAPTTYDTYLFVRNQTSWPSGCSSAEKSLEWTIAPLATSDSHSQEGSVEIVPKSTQRGEIESSEEIFYSYDASSSRAANETPHLLKSASEQSPLLVSPEESLPTDPKQAPVNTPETKQRCERLGNTATAVFNYVSVLAQIIASGLMLSAVTIGLMYWNRCSPNRTPLYVFVMGCTGLGYFVLRMLIFLISCTTRSSLPFDVLAYASLFTSILVLCYEWFTLPPPEDHGSCNVFFQYTLCLNIVIIVNVFLFLLHYFMRYFSSAKTPCGLK